MHRFIHIEYDITPCDVSQVLRIIHVGPWVLSSILSHNRSKDFNDPSREFLDAMNKFDNMLLIVRFLNYKPWNALAIRNRAFDCRIDPNIASQFAAMCR